MSSREVNEFLQEIDRQEFKDVEIESFDVHTPVVNGISDANSIETYAIKIDALLFDFLAAIKHCARKDLLAIRQALERSSLKLQGNFQRIEAFKGKVHQYRHRSQTMDFQEQMFRKERYPIYKLFIDVYNHQTQVLIRARRAVEEALEIIEDATPRGVDPSMLFILRDSIRDERIIQKITNTLRSEGCIDVTRGGDAANFKLLFKKFNPKLIAPKKITWLKEYGSLSFFLKALADLALDEPKTAGINQYSKGCNWFVNGEGISFPECSDNIKRRFRGKTKPYLDFYRKLKGDIEE